MAAMDDNTIKYHSSSHSVITPLISPSSGFPPSGTDWKAKYLEVADMLAETRAELDDFHHSSKELEEELERELERTEKAQQELKVKVARAETERDDWKVCHAFVPHRPFSLTFCIGQVHVSPNHT